MTFFKRWRWIAVGDSCYYNVSSAIRGSYVRYEFCPSFYRRSSNLSMRGVQLCVSLSSSRPIELEASLFKRANHHFGYLTKECRRYCSVKGIREGEGEIEGD